METSTKTNTRPRPKHAAAWLRMITCWDRLFPSHRKAPSFYDAASNSSSDRVEKTGHVLGVSSEKSLPSSKLFAVENDSSKHFHFPKVQSALVVARKGEYEIRHDFPVPQEIGDEEIMIRTAVVGLNPIDWKSVDYNFCLPEFPWVTGREMSGQVVRVGKAVRGLKAGDMVWTSTYYRDIRAGCFQEYIVVPGHTVLPIPDTVSMEHSACLGVAALTAAMTLWRWLGVQMPSTQAAEPLTESENEQWLLIWGGSTVTGQFATQLAVMSGLKVVTVNSTTTSELSKRLGASHVVVRDGKTEQEIVDEIQLVTRGGVTRAIDLVGTKTAKLVLGAVSSSRPVHFAPLAMIGKDAVVPENVTVHTVEMKQFVLDPSSGSYASELNRLLQRNTLKLPELVVMDGGLKDVISGLNLLKQGNMSGKKLVVKF